MARPMPVPTERPADRTCGVEPFEHALVLVGRDAGTIVVDVDHDGVVGRSP